MGRPRPAAPAQMLDAALDAIEVLLVEASAQPEPLLEQTRKIARAARAWRTP